MFLDQYVDDYSYHLPPLLLKTLMIPRRDNDGYSYKQVKTMQTALVALLPSDESESPRDCAFQIVIGPVCECGRHFPVYN